MEGPAAEGLPSTHLDDNVDRTLEKGVSRLVTTEVGLPVRYFEQLYTFGDEERAPGSIGPIERSPRNDARPRIAFIWIVAAAAWMAAVLTKDRSAPSAKA